MELHRLEFFIALPDIIESDCQRYMEYISQVKL